MWLDAVPDTVQKNYSERHPFFVLVVDYWGKGRHCSYIGSHHIVYGGVPSCSGYLWLPRRVREQLSLSCKAHLVLCVYWIWDYFRQRFIHFLSCVAMISYRILHWRLKKIYLSFFYWCACVMKYPYFWVVLYKTKNVSSFSKTDRHYVPCLHIFQLHFCEYLTVLFF